MKIKGIFLMMLSLCIIGLFTVAFVYPTVELPCARGSFVF